MGCLMQAKDKKANVVLNGNELEREDALRVCGQGLTAPPNPNHLPPEAHSWLHDFYREKHMESKDARHSGS